MIRSRRPIPNWIMAVIVVVTAGITVWAMLETGLAGELASTPPYWSGQLPERAWAGAGTGGAPNYAFPAAATSGIPVLRAGTPPVHADRGVCTNCHMVVGAQGTSIPPIRAQSALPHEFRGVCVNCHAVVLGWDGTTTNGAAALPTAAIGVPPPGSGFGAPLAGSGSAPTEGEWLGLEVGPIDARTATRSGIDPGTAGVVVTDSEAQAACAGLAVGDVVASVNAVPIRSMDDFLQATEQGALEGGAVEVLREDRYVRFDLYRGLACGAAGGGNVGPIALPRSGGPACAVGQGRWEPSGPPFQNGTGGTASF